VLQLINARNETGARVPFSPPLQEAVAVLLVAWAHRLGRG
jgi:hypothetical protein